MPKQINTYQVGQSLVKKFGLKGRFQPVLDETIVPVVSVGDSAPEDIRLAAGGQAAAAAGAGNVNRIFFSNPAGSKVLITVTSFWGVSGTPLTDAVSAIVDPGGISVSGTEIWRDSRLHGIPQMRSGASTTATAALGLPRYHLDDDDVQWFGKWILAPGAFMRFQQAIANTTLEISLLFEETDITATVGA